MLILATRIDGFTKLTSYVLAARGALEHALHSKFLAIPDLRGFGLAGVPGFEPGHGGIKIHCLTAWLHPIKAHASSIEFIWLFKPDRKAEGAGYSRCVSRSCIASFIGGDEAFRLRRTSQ